MSSQNFLYTKEECNNIEYGMRSSFKDSLNFILIVIIPYMSLISKNNTQ
jgi:hypothetical protein